MNESKARTGSSSRSGGTATTNLLEFSDHAIVFLALAPTPLTTRQRLGSSGTEIVSFFELATVASKVPPLHPDGRNPRFSTM